MSQSCSSSSVFRVTRANLPPLAFSVPPSSILANPPRSPTEDENGDEDDWLAKHSRRFIAGLAVHRDLRPGGTGPLASLPRHFVPGYYRAVPPGRKPFTHRSVSH